MFSALLQNIAMFFAKTVKIIARTKKWFLTEMYNIRNKCATPSLFSPMGAWVVIKS